MQIDKRLNITMEVEDGDGNSLHVHHAPIMQNIFEQHALFIGKAMNIMYEEGLHPAMCTRIAYITMRDLSRADRFKNIENTLFAEMWRLTNVLMPVKGRGWETVPFYELINNRGMDPRDIMEVQNFICFFTAAYWLHGKKEREDMFVILANSGVQTTSLDVTDYRSSLPTLTQDANTGATATASSIPS